MGSPKKTASERSDSNVGQLADSATVNAPAVWKSPSELTPWAKNPKPIEAKDIREMKRSIRRFGFGAPIVARAENLEIIEGHLRHAAALAMRLERVPVRVLDLSSDEAHVLAIAAWKFEHRREADEKEVADILEDLEDRNALSGTSTIGTAGMGDRPCAVFEYIGEAMPRKEAERLLA